MNITRLTVNGRAVDDDITRPTIETLLSNLISYKVTKSGEVIKDITIDGIDILTVAPPVFYPGDVYQLMHKHSDEWYTYIRGEVGWSTEKNSIPPTDKEMKLAVLEGRARKCQVVPEV